MIECNKLSKYNTTHYNLPQLQYIITSTNPKQEPLVKLHNSWFYVGIYTDTSDVFMNNQQP